MPVKKWLATGLGLCMAALVPACGGAAPPVAISPAPATSPVGGLRASETASPALEVVVDFERDLEDFDPSNFQRPLAVANPWFPLQPGSRLVLEGSTEQAGREVPHSIVFTVTDLTKEIAGVPAIVAWVLDYSNDELVEAELAFYAQDDDGNVWFLGEYPEVYELGKLVEAPAWITGLKGAKAGILMKAEPVVGEPSYSMGWGPAVNWTDRAQVAQVGAQTCVPAGCYDDVLVIEEFSREEPGAFQLKYYAPGVGNVRVGWRGEDATREELELVDWIQLNAGALAEARAAALELEARAYEISQEVYDQTPPAEVRADLE